jgi:hypothetical protein
MQLIFFWTYNKGPWLHIFLRWFRLDAVGVIQNNKLISNKKISKPKKLLKVFPQLLAMKKK